MTSGAALPNAKADTTRARRACLAEKSHERTDLKEHIDDERDHTEGADGGVAENLERALTGRSAEGVRKICNRVQVNRPGDRGEEGNRHGCGQKDRQDLRQADRDEPGDPAEGRSHQREEDASSRNVASVEDHPGGDGDTGQKGHSSRASPQDRRASDHSPLHPRTSPSRP